MARGPAPHEQPTAEIPAVGHATQPIPTVSKFDAPHILAEAAAVTAVTHVIREDCEALKALIDKMVELKDNPDARDNVAKRANEEIIQIYAAAEVAKHHAIPKEDKKELYDILALINKYYASKIVESGYDKPEYVNIDPAKPVLTGNVRDAFAKSLQEMGHKFESDAQHIASLWQAIEKEQERVLSTLAASGVDLERVVEKLGRMKSLLRDQVVTAPVGKESASAVPSEITVAPVPPTQIGPTA